MPHRTDITVVVLILLCLGKFAPLSKTTTLVEDQQTFIASSNGVRQTYFLNPDYHYEAWGHGMIPKTTSAKHTWSQRSKLTQWAQMFSYSFSILPITAFQLIANPFYSLPILLGTSCYVMIFLFQQNGKNVFQTLLFGLEEGLTGDTRSSDSNSTTGILLAAQLYLMTTSVPMCHSCVAFSMS